jgi:hypothetical protein
MESNNILAINIPNMVSITIMAVVGVLLIGLVAKGVGLARAGKSAS